MKGADPNNRGFGGLGSPMAFVGLGFELVAPILIGGYVGYRLDGWLETRPWLFLVGFLLGVLVGFTSFVRRVMSRGSGREE